MKPQFEGYETSVTTEGGTFVALCKARGGGYFTLCSLDTDDIGDEKMGSLIPRLDDGLVAFANLLIQEAKGKLDTELRKM